MKIQYPFQLAITALALLPISGLANAQSGENTYKQVCANCHGAGVLNAPKFGDKAAWAVRTKVGLDEVVKIATKGLNAMPPKGGSSATDAEIKAAITQFELSIKTREGALKAADAKVTQAQMALKQPQEKLNAALSALKARRGAARVAPARAGAERRRTRLHVAAGWRSSRTSRTVHHVSICGASSASKKKT